MKRITNENYKELGCYSYTGMQNPLKAPLTIGELAGYNADYSPRKILEDVFGRLAAYEDTGLEPEEVLTGKELAEVSCAINLLKEYQSIGHIDHLRELAQAEKDGWLVVLPCKVGDVVYVITSSTNIDEIESEETIDIFECKVESITSYSKRSTQFRLFYQEVFVTIFVTADDFGKTVFLTREEAEAAMKKREEANESD